MFYLRLVKKNNKDKINNCNLFYYFCLFYFFISFCIKIHNIVFFFFLSHPYITSLKFCVFFPLIIPPFPMPQVFPTWVIWSSSNSAVRHFSYATVNLDKILCKIKTKNYVKYVINCVKYYKSVILRAFILQALEIRSKGGEGG